ncbi:hypothetical protein BFS78_22435 (plasmid) [Yersinia enterocolitica]|nr:hypothetical protein BED34_00450 [Yersinia enterocolitica]AOF37658.1 hypothetical protein BFS78_22435 [Yersinia enterocolitica]
MGVNGYTRLTGWRDSPDVENYEERPANGWDIRSEGYLPAYPQLGAKLVYEQYYGTEVALFGRDNRQANPYAITVGVNYTPVPLVTISAEQREGKSGANDTRLALAFNYQLGVTLNKQLDSTTVAQRRSLMGSRYDLIERNNNIVLEYRKKDVIQLAIANTIQGYAGELKSLGVSVVTSNGLERIDWDSSGLIANGGRVIQQGSSQYNVLLPAYQNGGTNTYQLSAVAYDKKGNASSRVFTQVSVNAAPFNQQNSTFEPDHDTLPADGVSTKVLTLSLFDDHNQPIDVDLANIQLSVLPQVHNAHISPFTKISLGVFVTTVTAGNVVETLTLTPSVDNIPLNKPATLDIGQIVDPANSEFTAVPTTILADGVAATTLTFTPKDNNGSAVKGLTNVGFFVSNLANTVVSTVTENNGVYSATLKGTTPGIATVRPQIGGSNVGNLSKQVTLTAAVPLAFRNVLVTGVSFQVNQGFPKTGYTGAVFTLEGVNANDYTWSSDVPWVMVANGVVTLSAEPANKQEVTIKATPIAGVGAEYQYKFTIDKWFTHVASNKQYVLAISDCQNEGNGNAIPITSDMTDAETTGGFPDRRAANGHLWNEWGNISAIFPGQQWTSDVYPTDSTMNVTVLLTYGNTTPAKFDSNIGAQLDVSCVRYLQ